MDWDKTVDDIYEAGAIPEKWPRLLRRLSEWTGSSAALILAHTVDGLHGYESEGSWPARDDYIREGWATDTTRADWLMGDDYPGFRTDLDFATPEQLCEIPVYAQFLIPRGLDAGAATLVSGLDGDRLLMTFEGFSGHDASRAAIPALDRLRPHLARAVMLTARLRQAQIQASVEAMEMAGVPAAMITARGQIRSSNARFRTLFDQGPQPLLPVGARNRLEPLIEAARTGGGGSLAVATGDGNAVLHVLPVTGQARDIFIGCAAMILVATGSPASPDHDMLQMLYDLTPAEAQIAAQVAIGLNPATIARRNAVAIGTVRTHLKSIFSKTGLRSQTELAVHLAALNPVVRPR